jgi:thiamine biosynthesis lipoprotein
MLTYFALALSVFLAAGCTRAPELQTISNIAQGTTYTVKWWTSADFDAREFASAVENELARIDELMSNYRDDSVLERFNRSRTTAVQTLPEELVEILKIAAAVHEASAGCFDLTVRPLVSLWGFDTATPSVPDTASLTAARARVGFDKLELIDQQHVRKTVDDLEIDMSGIGQGYTVTRLVQLAVDRGLTDYLIEIGGEMAAHGTKPDGTSWRVGIEQPSISQPGVQRVLVLPAERSTAVMTSGTYRHFFEAGGHAYSHIIDPATGEPVKHDLVSVTIIHSDPTWAGAWSTALLCLGPERAAALAERAGLAVLLLVRAGDAIEERRSTSLNEEWKGVVE